jgi:L-fucose isomerase
MTHKRIGLISTMSPDRTWAQEVLDRVAATHGVVKAALEEMGFEVLDEGPLHRTYGEMQAAGRSLACRGANALVLYVGTWTYSNCAAAAALEARVPVVIWPDAAPGTCGLVGGTVARGALAEVGARAHLVYGLFDDPATRERVARLLRASCAAMGLRGLTLGVAGGRTLGMITATCDPTEVRVRFGVEVDWFEQTEVVERARRMDGAAAAACVDWLGRTFGERVASDEVLAMQAKLYLALEELCDERGYDFVAVRCLPELPGIYTTFCLAHALMGDAADHRGAKERFVFACEADINAALTMQLMLLLTGGPVLFADLTEFDFEDDLLVTCNCGSQPTDFAASKADVRWEREGVHEFQWAYGGACPQHVARAGRCTLARLSREQGRYEMLIAPAEAVEVPRERLRRTVWERPHAFFRLLCDRDAFFGAVRSNHIHMAYSDWREELVEACEILGVKPVVVA